MSAIARSRMIVLAGIVVAAGIGALTLAGSHRPTAPHQRIVFVPAPPAARTTTTTPIAAPAIDREALAVTTASAPAAEEGDGVPPDYPYWDQGDGGIWATPADDGDAE